MCRLIPTSIEDELAELMQKAASHKVPRAKQQLQQQQQRGVVFLPPKLVRWVPRDPRKSSLSRTIVHLHRLQTPKLR